MVFKNFDYDINMWKMEDNIYKNVFVDFKLYIKFLEYVFYNLLFKI